MVAIANLEVARGGSAVWGVSICALAWILLGGIAQAAEPETAPPPPPLPDRALTVQAAIGLDVILTDNVALTADDGRSDAIIGPALGLTIDVATPRAEANLDGEVRYDVYANDTDRNGWWVNGSASGSYALIEDALWLKANGLITNGSISTFETAASDRHGSPGQVQLSSYDVGPEVRVRLGESVALAGAARFAQVIYSDASDEDPEFVPPQDDSIAQVIGSANMGAPATRFQLQVAGEYIHDDLDFTSTLGVASAFVRVSPTLRVFGRAGYEDLSQASALDLNAPIVTAGIEYRPNNLSEFRIEGGTRYDRTTWAVDGFGQLNKWLYVSAAYSETVQPDQIGVARSLRAFTESAERLDSPLVRTDPILPGLYNETSLYRAADLRGVYSRGGNTLDATVTWVDRKFLTGAGGQDRTLLTDFMFSRQVREDFWFRLRTRYIHTYETPRFGPSQAFRLSAEAAYQVNQRTELRANLSRTDNRELVTQGEHITENALLVGLRRRF